MDIEPIVSKDTAIFMEDGNGRRKRSISMTRGIQYAEKYALSFAYPVRMRLFHPSVLSMHRKRQNLHCISVAFPFKVFHYKGASGKWKYTKISTGDNWTEDDVLTLSQGRCCHRCLWFDSVWKVIEPKQIKCRIRFNLRYQVWFTSILYKK